MAGAHVSTHLTGLYRLWFPTNAFVDSKLVHAMKTLGRVDVQLQS
jgi:hypothetical protein